MDATLVFELVWQVAIRPQYERNKRKYADEMNRIVCGSGVGSVQESCLSGMMEILDYVSNSILIKYGFATPWYTRERVDIYYPLHIKGLDLAFRRQHRPRVSNTLGGFRI